jgi:hypothetical protein
MPEATTSRPEVADEAPATHGFVVVDNSFWTSLTIRKILPPALYAQRIHALTIDRTDEKFVFVNRKTAGVHKR